MNWVVVKIFVKPIKLLNVKFSYKLKIMAIRRRFYIDRYTQVFALYCVFRQLRGNKYKNF